jgi:hypothetical protein
MLQMEKEQIIESYRTGKVNSFEVLNAGAVNMTAEQYYKETYESNEATENLNISDVSDSVYFIRVSVKIDKSLYNRTADIKDIVRTELMSAEIKGVLWNYKIEQIDSGDGKDWEFLVNFFTKMNKTQIQNYFDRNTLGSENYQVL